MNTEKTDGKFQSNASPVSGPSEGNVYLRHGLYVSHEYVRKCPLHLVASHPKPVHNFTRKVAVAIDKASIMAKDKELSETDISFLLQDTALNMNGAEYVAFFMPRKRINSINIFNEDAEIVKMAENKRKQAHRLVIIDDSRQVVVHEVGTLAKKDSLPLIATRLSVLPDFIAYLSTLGVYAAGQLGASYVSFYTSEFEQISMLNTNCDLRKLLCNHKREELVTVGSGTATVWKLALKLDPDGALMLNTVHRLSIKMEQNVADYIVDAFIDFRRQLLGLALSNRINMYELATGKLAYGVANITIGRISSVNYAEAFGFILYGTTKGKLAVCDSLGNVLHVFHHSNMPILQIPLGTGGDLVMLFSKFEVYFDSLHLFSEQYSYQARGEIVNFLGIDSTLLAVQTEKSVSLLSFRSVSTNVASFDSKIVSLTIGMGQRLHKTSHLMAAFDDDVVRLLTVQTGLTRTYQLPYFDVQNIQQLLYSRILNKSFVLLKSGDLWLLVTDSIPCIAQDIWMAPSSPANRVTSLWLYEDLQCDLVFLLGGNVGGQLVLYSRYGGPALSLQLHRDPILSISGDNQSRLVCTVSDKNQIRVSKLLISERSQQVSVSALGSVTLAGDVKSASVCGLTVAVSLSDGSLVMYRVDLLSGELVPLPSHLKTDDHSESTEFLVALPHSGHFATTGGADRLLKLWSTETNTLVRDIDMATFAGPIVADSDSGDLYLVSNDRLLLVRENKWLEASEKGILSSTTKKAAHSVPNVKEDGALRVPEVLSATVGNPAAEKQSVDSEAEICTDMLIQDWDSLLKNALVRQWKLGFQKENVTTTSNECNLRLYHDWRNGPPEDIYSTPQGAAYAKITGNLPNLKLEEIPEELMSPEMKAIRLRLGFLRKMHALFISKLADSRVGLSQLNKVRRSDPYLQTISELISGNSTELNLQSEELAEYGSGKGIGLFEPPSPLIKRKKHEQAVIENEQALSELSGELDFTYEAENDIKWVNHFTAAGVEIEPSKNSNLARQTNVSAFTTTGAVQNVKLQPPNLRSNLSKPDISKLASNWLSNSCYGNPEQCTRSFNRDPSGKEKRHAAVSSIAEQILPQFAAKGRTGCQSAILEVNCPASQLKVKGELSSRGPSAESKVRANENGQRSQAGKASEYFAGPVEAKLELKEKRDSFTLLPKISSNDSLDSSSAPVPIASCPAELMDKDPQRVMTGFADDCARFHNEEEAVKSSGILFSNQCSEGDFEQTDVAASESIVSLDSHKQSQHSLLDGSEALVDATRSLEGKEKFQGSDSPSKVAILHLSEDNDELKTIGSIIEENLEVQQQIQLCASSDDLRLKFSESSHANNLTLVQRVLQGAGDQKVKQVPIPPILRPIANKKWFPKYAFFRDLLPDEFSLPLAVTPMGLVISDCDPNSIIEVLAPLILESVKEQTPLAKASLSGEERVEIFQFVFWMEFLYGISSTTALQKLVFEYLLSNPYSENISLVEQELRSSLLELSLLFDETPIDLMTVLLVYSISPFRILREKSHRILEDLGVRRVKSDVLFHQIAHLYALSNPGTVVSATNFREELLTSFPPPSNSQIELLWKIYQCDFGEVRQSISSLRPSEFNTAPTFPQKASELKVKFSVKSSDNVNQPKGKSRGKGTTEPNTVDSSSQVVADTGMHLTMPQTMHLSKRLRARVADIEYLEQDVKQLWQVESSYAPLIPVIRLGPNVSTRLLANSFASFLRQCLICHHDVKLADDHRRTNSQQNIFALHSEGTPLTNCIATAKSTSALNEATPTKRGLASAVGSTLSLSAASPIKRIQRKSQKNAISWTTDEDEISVADIYNAAAETQLFETVKELVSLGWKPTNRRSREILNAYSLQVVLEDKKMEEGAFPTIENCILSDSQGLGEAASLVEVHQPSQDLQLKDSIKQAAELKMAQFRVLFTSFMFYRLLVYSYRSLEASKGLKISTSLPQVVTGLNRFIISAEKNVICRYVQSCQQKLEHKKMLAQLKADNEKEIERERLKKENMEKFLFFKKREEILRNELNRKKNSGSVESRALGPAARYSVANLPGRGLEAGSARRAAKLAAARSHQAGDLKSAKAKDRSGKPEPAGSTKLNAISAGIVDRSGDPEASKERQESSKTERVESVGQKSMKKRAKLRELTGVSKALSQDSYTASDREINKLEDTQHLDHSNESAKVVTAPSGLPTLDAAVDVASTFHMGKAARPETENTSFQGIFQSSTERVEILPKNMGEEHAVQCTRDTDAATLNGYKETFETMEHGKTRNRQASVNAVDSRLLVPSKPFGKELNSAFATKAEFTGAADPRKLTHLESIGIAKVEDSSAIMSVSKREFLANETQQSRIAELQSKVIRGLFNNSSEALNSELENTTSNSTRHHLKLVNSPFTATAGDGVYFSSREALPKRVVFLDSVSLGKANEGLLGERKKAPSDPRISRPWSSRFAQSKVPQKQLDQLRPKTSICLNRVAEVSTITEPEFPCQISMPLLSQEIENLVRAEYDLVKNKGRSVRQARSQNLDELFKSKLVYSHKSQHKYLKLKP